MRPSNFILASKSKARQDMLRGAGFDFEINPANIDERKIEDEMTAKGKSFADIALELGKQKALVLSKDSDDLIIGSDQILVFNDRVVSKADNVDVARERLKSFRGQTHILISSVAVARKNQILWHETAQAHLTMRSFSDEFLESYITNAGDALTNCVGCYALEQLGIQLFENIDGDYFTILGMPLLPLIGYLQKEGLGL